MVDIPIEDGNLLRVAGGEHDSCRHRHRVVEAEALGVVAVGRVSARVVPWRPQPRRRKDCPTPSLTVFKENKSPDNEASKNTHTRPARRSVVAEIILSYPIVSYLVLYCNVLYASYISIFYLILY